MQIVNNCIMMRVWFTAVLWQCWLGDRKDIWPTTPNSFSSVSSVAEEVKEQS